MLAHICRWFGQQIEFKIGVRRFDREKNSALLKEANQKMEDLGVALELGSGVKDAAVDLGSVCFMLAYNAEKGLGDEEIAPPPEEQAAIDTLPEDKKPPVGTNKKAQAQRRGKNKKA